MATVEIDLGETARDRHEMTTGGEGLPQRIHNSCAAEVRTVTVVTAWDIAQAAPRGSTDKQRGRGFNPICTGHNNSA